MSDFVPASQFRNLATIGRKKLKAAGALRPTQTLKSAAGVSLTAHGKKLPSATASLLEAHLAKLLEEYPQPGLSHVRLINTPKSGLLSGLATEHQIYVNVPRATGVKGGGLLETLSHEFGHYVQRSAGITDAGIAGIFGSDIAGMPSAVSQAIGSKYAATSGHEAFPEIFRVAQHGSTDPRVRRALGLARSSVTPVEIRKRAKKVAAEVIDDPVAWPWEEVAGVVPKARGAIETVAKKGMSKGGLIGIGAAIAAGLLLTQHHSTARSGLPVRSTAPGQYPDNGRYTQRY